MFRRKRESVYRGLLESNTVEPLYYRCFGIQNFWLLFTEVFLFQRLKNVLTRPVGTKFCPHYLKYGGFFYCVLTLESFVKRGSTVKFCTLIVKVLTEILWIG